MNETPPQPRRRFDSPDLRAAALLLAVSALIRIPFFGNYSLVTYDGTHYLNQARHFFSTTTSWGSFPIGYPMLSAIVGFVVRDIVLAGRIVSLLAGLGSITVMYFLARLYTGRPVAFLSALSLSVTPLLIRYSETTMSEALYLFALLFGLLLYARRRMFPAGLSLGFAAITRPEVLGIFGLLALMRARAVRPLALLLVGFAVFYAVGVAHTFVRYNRLEPLPKRQFAGASSVMWHEHERVIEKSGDDLRSTKQLGGAGATKTAVNYLKRMPRELWLLVKHSGFLPVLLAIFALRRRRPFLLAALLPLAVYPAFTPRTEERYLLPYVPVVLVMAGIAVETLDKERLRRIGYAILVVSMAAGIAANRLHLKPPIDATEAALADIGKELRGTIPRGARIADRKPFLAFYAEGDYIEIPAAPYDETIEYLVDRNVDYLSVDAAVARMFRPALLPLVFDEAVIRGEVRFKQFYGKGGTIVYERDDTVEPLRWIQLTGGGDSAPAWSPDGSTLLFVTKRAGNADIYAIPSSGGEAVPVIDWPSEESYPIWMTGETIAFCSNREGKTHVYSINVVTGHVERMTQDDTNALAPAVSKTGELAFVSNRSGRPEIWLRNTDGVQQMTNDGDNFYPSFSPTGRRVAWVKPQKGLFVDDRQTGKTRRIAVPRNVNLRPAWSPDGRYIAVSGKDWGSVDIYVASVEDNGVLLLTTTPGYDAEPAWSTDGDRLAISSVRSGVQGIWAAHGVTAFLEARFSPSMQIMTVEINDQVPPRQTDN